MLKIKLSVRKLVESVLRSGDINNSYRSAGRMLEGTLAHQKLQKSYGADYESELSLRGEFVCEDILLALEGRADGVFSLAGGGYAVQEIKSTRLDLASLEEDHNPLHWAQVKFYGLMLIRQEDLASIELRLSYYQLDSEELKEFSKTFERDQLEAYASEIIQSYIDWARTSFYWKKTRNSSIRDLKFPFKAYRQGQRELAVAVYKTIQEKNKLYLQAPTGIGKTMSTLFPALKAMESEKLDKIFYLTAKTISRQSPIKAYEILRDQGLDLKLLVLTSKEKVCLNSSLDCNPESCPYAKGHFDRVNGAIKDIFQQEDLFSRETIQAYGEKYQVCPFEFSLDLADFADLIVCDYNYVFDPQVALKRFFDLAKSDYIFLVDEVHNLVDRGRAMYSAGISDREILDLVDYLEGDKKAQASLGKILDGIDIAFEKNQVEKQFYRDEAVDQLFGPIHYALLRLDKYLVNNKGAEGYEKVLDFYFKLVSYLKISDYYDEHFYSSFQEEDGVRTIKINCMDPSYLLRQSLNKAASSILFSATLSPMDYYMDLLGGSGKNYHMILSSPFPRENLSISIVDNLSTKYRQREASYGDVLAYIKDFTSYKDGNYLVFFPSFSYMERIYQLLEADEFLGRVLVQDRLMTEKAREEFLQAFDGSGQIGFAVLGGIFSEAIDLVGEKLIGAVIVGVGLPRVGFENNMLKDYFTRYFNRGFDYAYSYPGMNKVFQGAGRVIRQEEDRGALLLIDTRYRERLYQDILPSHWQGYNIIRSRQDLKYVLEKFWNEA